MGDEPGDDRQDLLEAAGDGFRVGLAAVATSSLKSQSSQGLLARKRLRHAASEMSARPISTAHAPSRRVDRDPRT
jgi:hypothetical protein